MGKNLVLTCHHIFRPNSSQPVWIRFGYRTQSSQGTPFELDTDFVISDHKLDYALLRVKDTPKQIQKTPVNTELNGEQHIRIIHHPKGQPAVISDLVPIVQVGAEYIDYKVDTDNGSSGAPVFNRDWQMVAIHLGKPGIARAAVEGTTAALPIRAIWDTISAHLF